MKYIAIINAPSYISLYFSSVAEIETILWPLKHYNVIKLPKLLMEIFIWICANLQMYFMNISNI